MSRKTQTAVFLLLLCVVVAASLLTLPPAGQPAGAAELSAAAWQPRSAQQDAININTATEAQLCTLPGIGAKRAQSIVAYRSAFGPFATVDDLAQVEGISPALVERVRASVCTQES